VKQYLISLPQQTISSNIVWANLFGEGVVNETVSVYWIVIWTAQWSDHLRGCLGAEVAAGLAFSTKGAARAGGVVMMRSVRGCPKKYRRGVLYTRVNKSRPDCPTGSRPSRLQSFQAPTMFRPGPRYSPTMRGSRASAFAFLLLVGRAVADEAADSPPAPSALLLPSVSCEGSTFDADSYAAARQCETISGSLIVDP